MIINMLIFKGFYDDFMIL